MYHLSGLYQNTNMSLDRVMVVVSIQLVYAIGAEEGTLGR
jgi:hypothetical protein